MYLLRQSLAVRAKYVSRPSCSRLIFNEAMLFANVDAPAFRFVTTNILQSISVSMPANCICKGETPVALQMLNDSPLATPTTLLAIVVLLYLERHKFPTSALKPQDRNLSAFAFILSRDPRD